MAQEIPVYLFTGFMDSGKTTLVNETLFENDFAEGGKGIIIMCEDGDVEYDPEKLKTVNFQVVTIDSEEEFTEEKMKEINLQYLPEQVFIEYNGTWGMDKILEMNLPKDWIIVQSLATVDSTTFEMYMNNMRAMMQEQVFSSDVVIFNRTDDNTDRGKFRRLIKTINRKAQIVYERKDGTIDERPEELPFDINQDIIELSDADYAIWYMDAMDNYKKYDGKKVKFRARVYNPDKLKKGKHTTKHVELFDFSENSYIADTPGFSSFDVDGINYKELDKYFIEFAPFSQECEFRSCTHIKELNCGVKKAVAKRKIDKGRYERYTLLFEKMKGDKKW